MASIGRASFSQKPRLGSRVNAGDTLATGLIGFFNFSERGGLTCANSYGVYQPGQFNMGDGTIQWCDTQGGSGLKFTTIDITTYIMSPKIVAPPAISVFAKFRTDSLANAYTAVVSADNNAVPFGPELMFKSSGKLAPYICDNIGTQINCDGTGTGVLVSGQWATCGFTYSSALMTSYFNGQVDATAATGHPADSTLFDLKIGNTGFGSRNFNGIVEWVGIWNRVITPWEAKRLYANPYSMFAIPRRRSVKVSITPFLVSQPLIVSDAIRHASTW